MSYKNTRLYKDGFKNHDLKGAYEQMRKRVETLVASASYKLIGLTVHDITHLDALWGLAEKIAGKKFSLNPAEAFIFGGAILLHDAGNSLYAYHDGVESLKKLTLWQDYAANSTLDDDQLAFKVIRQIHADQALKLIDQEFKDANGVRYFIIEPPELRLQLGQTIGKIAQSHGKDIETIEGFKEKFEYMGYEVDPLKLACLLRAADACHLDIKRAPYFLRTLIKPVGVSALHWDFQQKLQQPSRDDKTQSLTFISSSDFSINEQAAWWLAFDHLHWADQELQKCERFLFANDRATFAAKSIKGAQNPLALSKFVKTTLDWKPYDSRIKISDPVKIAENLGGSRLYGDKPQVALRELLQNAMDAVQARRLHKNDEEYGAITVALEQRSGDWWLSVEDNGVGMSQFVLTEILLDFGKSLWRSDAMAQELSGIAAKGMEANGRYGIGFYSIFILGEHVKVTTLKMGTEQKAYQLEFKNGLKTRPEITVVDKGYVDGGGTKVEVKLKRNLKLDDVVDLSNLEYFQLYVTQIAPASEVDLYCKFNAEKKLTIKKDDWITMSDDLFIERLNITLKNVINDIITIQTTTFVETIENGTKNILGRGFLSNNYNPSKAIFIEKGLSVKHDNFAFTGFLKTTSTNLARNEHEIKQSTKDALAKWAKAQKQDIIDADISDEIKANISISYYKLCGDYHDLPIFFIRNEKIYINAIKLKKLILQHKIVYLISFINYAFYNQGLSKVQVDNATFNEIFVNSRFVPIDLFLDCAEEFGFVINKESEITLQSKEGYDVTFICETITVKDHMP